MIGYEPKILSWARPDWAQPKKYQIGSNRAQAKKYKVGHGQIGHELKMPSWEWPDWALAK